MPGSPEKLLFQLFTIFVAAKIVGEIFERLKLPAVLGEILGGAVFDDILGMVLLAIVAGLASGTAFQWLHLGILTFEAVAFAAFMLFFGARMMRPLQRRVHKLSAHNAPLIISLAICLFLS